MAREKDRDAHLREMSEEYGVPMYVVRSLADLLGPAEDYDGLVSALEDYNDMYGE